MIRNQWITLAIALLILKLSLLVNAHEKLVQIHWRIQSEGPSLWEHLLLGAMLLGSILIPLWQRPKIKPCKTRKIMAPLFLLLLAILMPETINRNYIRVVAKTPLTVWDLRHYFVLDLFFRPPYLALHLLALIGGWYASVKRKDDRFYLSVFAVLISTTLCTYLIREGHALVEADLIVLATLLTLGIAQLFFHYRITRQKWSLPVILGATLVGCAFFADVTRPQLLPYYFVYLAIGITFAEWLSRNLFGPGRKNDFLVVFWCYCLFAAINFGYPIDANTGNIFRLGLLFGRYFAGDIILILLLFLALRMFRRTGLILFAMSAALYLGLAYIDLNYHINAAHRFRGFLLEMGGDTQFTVSMLSEYLTPAFFGLFLALLLLGLSGPLISIARAKSSQTNPMTPIKCLLIAICVYILGLIAAKPDPFIASAPRNSLMNLPVVERLRSKFIPEEEIIRGFKSTGIPLRTIPRDKMQTGNESKQKYNLLFVILESMQNTHLSLFGGEDETQPELAVFTNRMTRFPNIFCNWPSSNHARISMWTGLYPVRTYLSRFNPDIAANSLTEILHREGYFNAVFYSSDRNYTRLNDYLQHREIDLFEDSATLNENIADAQHVSWGVREDVTLQAMKDFIGRRAGLNRPFALTYIPACPHMPYDTHSEEFDRFQDGFGPLDGNYTGAYKNQILYMDHILAELLKHLERNDSLEDTLVVMISDHGEMVNSEVNGLGHGWRTSPRLANICLMILPPNAERATPINRSIGSQVDILPTILDYLDIPLPSGMPIQGLSLKSKRNSNRRIYLGSYLDFAVIEGDRFHWFKEGAPDKAKCYGITNEGADTIFSPISVRRNRLRELAKQYDDFQRYQDSLLKHYRRYKDFDIQPVKR